MSAAVDPLFVIAVWTLAGAIGEPGDLERRLFFLVLDSARRSIGLTLA